MTLARRAGWPESPCKPDTAKESNVLATGGLLVCSVLLTLAAVAPVFRSSNPPRWTPYGEPIISLGIACTLPLGLAYLGAGLIGAVQTGPDYLELGLLGVVLLVAIIISRRLRARTKRRALEADANVSELGDADGTGLVAVAESLEVSASESPRHRTG
jgi:hypothetical protein